MKLKNKQTGEIGVLEAATYHGGRPDNIVEVYEVGMGAVRVLAQYHTLEELNKDWEDCNKPAEPLIEDEKIRKCVRLWAEINEFKGKLMYSKSDDYCSFYEADSQEELLFLNRECPNLKHAVKYTIAELCGDSKEDEDEA